MEIVGVALFAAALDREAELLGEAMDREAALLRAAAMWRAA